jgi:glycerate dehydrogenase
MKRRLLVIDTARGGFVIEDAFVRALKANQISGAGFHVATKKPLPVDHPFNEIQNHPAFILAPRVAWASEEAIQSSLTSSWTT